MRCPLGCREHHRTMCSKHRSGAYYRSEEGRKKKRRHNAARSRDEVKETPGAVNASESPNDTGSPSPHISPLPTATTLPLVELEFKESIIEYTRLIMDLTGARKVSHDEALATLRRVVRQRSLDSP